MILKIHSSTIFDQNVTSRVSEIIKQNRQKQTIGFQFDKLTLNHSENVQVNNQIPINDGLKSDHQHSCDLNQALNYACLEHHELSQFFHQLQLLQTPLTKFFYCLQLPIFLMDML